MGTQPHASCPLPLPKDGFNNELGSITGIIREVTAVQELARDVLFLEQ